MGSDSDAALELQPVEPFPGAACCQPTELALPEAAPLRSGLRDAAV
jgi:hypothetical protein